MYNFPIGVIVDSFDVEIPEAVKKAADVGAQGIQVYATYGDMSPENLVGTKRSEFLAAQRDTRFCRTRAASLPNMPTA